MKFNFLAFKINEKPLFQSVGIKKVKKRKQYLRSRYCNSLLTICFKHPLLQIIYFTDMKVGLYARDLNINRKDGKKYVEIQKN